jgi:hypothetical protein
MWRGGVDALSVSGPFVSGASLASPCFRFHIPLIEPDMRISRLSETPTLHLEADGCTCPQATVFRRRKRQR